STDGERKSPPIAKMVLGFSRFTSLTSVARRAMPPRRPPSTGPSTYASLIWRKVSRTRSPPCAGASREAQPTGISVRTARSAASGGAGRGSRLPEAIGSSRDAMGQQALGPIRVPRPEACLEQRVVEHVALGAAAAELDDARGQRLEPLDRAPVVARGECMNAL